MYPDLVALIGVRGGSKRVPQKNSRPFCGTNLLCLKIKQLFRIPGIDLVVVNSDCDQLLNIAHQAGAKTIRRDPAFATDAVLASDYYRHVAETCPGNTILSATVTTPLVSDESYISGIRAYQSLDRSKYDSVTSCQSIKEFLYLDGKPLNYDPENQVPSQNLPDIVSINYGYSIIERKQMIHSKNIVGKRPYFIKMCKIESVDIDTEEDFKIAEMLYTSMNGGENAQRCAA